MFFLPFAFIFLILFIIFLPILFLLGYLHIIVVGFERLGISPESTLLILFLILIGSSINIPLTKKKLVSVREPRFFGLFSVPKIEAQYLAINLGGAIIPTLLSFYFLFLVQSQGFELRPIFITIVLMTIISKLLSRVIPGKGIVLPAFIPPLFSAVFALIFAPQFAASTAFISGVLGTLIGADLLNLRKIRSYGGYLSIGGAGVFDGIFLVGIVSALLSGI
ncbi:MAG: DUF1614 domain-containing protein [Patescibacteria group bacterium]|nr:DUF1614 domain-containing protein [Patescibacteria group bacterium]